MRLQATVALIVSVVVVALGLFLALSRAGTDMASFGWVLVAIGALFAVANVLLRTRM